MESSSIVYFEGPWSEAEAVRVEAAAQAVESSEALDLGLSSEAPWVAIAEPGGNEELYFASRRGSAAVLSAESAEDLAERIRAFRDSAPISFV